MQTTSTKRRQPQPAFPSWLPVILHLYNHRPAQNIMQCMPSENKRHQETEEKGNRGNPIAEASDTSPNPSQIFSVFCNNADSENALPDRLLAIGRKIREVVQYHKNKSECQHRGKLHESVKKDS